MLNHLIVTIYLNIAVRSGDTIPKIIFSLIIYVYDTNLI